MGITEGKTPGVGMAMADVVKMPLGGADMPREADATEVTGRHKATLLGVVLGEQGIWISSL